LSIYPGGFIMSSNTITARHTAGSSFSSFEELGNAYFDAMRERVRAVLWLTYDLHPDLMEAAIDEAVAQGVKYPELAEDMQALTEQALVTTVRHTVLFSNTLKGNAAEVLGGGRLKAVLPDNEYRCFHKHLNGAAAVIVRGLRRRTARH
jgi:hypothetical protein